MTREEAIADIKNNIKPVVGGKSLDMAIEALQTLEAVERIKTEVLPQTDLVRCKDCRHRDLFSCPLADNDFQKDDDYCSWGERREP
jgi:hypothetical protein